MLEDELVRGTVPQLDMQNPKDCGVPTYDAVPSC